MNDIMKIGLRLFIITVIAAILMGVTNLATQEPIRLQRVKAENRARQAALPQAEDFAPLDVVAKSAESGDAKITELYTGQSSNDVVGYVFKVETRGYVGDMDIVIGINTEDKIEAVQIGEHSETPGLGAKAKGKPFLEQFRGKQTEPPLSAAKNLSGDDEEVDAEASSTVDGEGGATQVAGDSQQIEAIAGATVTSGAVTRAINLALEYYNELLKNGGGN